MTHRDAGVVKCTATKQSTTTIATSGREVVSCSTLLSVVSDFDKIGAIEDSCGTASGSVLASMEVLDNDENQKSSMAVNGDGDTVVSDEPAMLVKKPEDVTALVGGRVLLKATYIGHPEPTVRWTKAVSLNFKIENKFFFAKSSDDDIE